ncbi:MAG: GntR family transcriptional regulator [Clostridiales bacterium]|jgi:DNA-binding GntR family transcriptional regulator|nr:GntR family transcriptional regulator [Clostridiales bacterium]
MDLEMDKSSGVPLYIQIKDQIIRDINNKKFISGQKMPTERELAKRLLISRNTISAAYKLLIKDGVLVSYQGRGTFVAQEDSMEKAQRFYNRIDSLMDDALEKGFSPDEFLQIVQVRVKEKEEEQKRVTALFVECNVEQARVFARELAEITNVNIRPLVLKELRENDGTIEHLLDRVQCVFSTFNHALEVRELISNRNIEVHGVAVKPCLEGIVRIARYPAGTKFGLISLSDEFRSKFERNLNSAGLASLNLTSTISRNEQDIKRLIDESDVIIVSPGRCEEITNTVAGQKDVIIFNTTLDLASAKTAIAKFATGKQ